MSYSYKIHHSAEEICRKDWDEVIKNSVPYIFMDYRFIKAVENALHKTTKFWNVLFYQNETPVACTILSLYPVDISLAAGAKMKKFVNVCRRVFPSFLQFNILFCGLPVSVGQKSLICTKDKHLGHIVPIIDSLMKEIAKKEKCQLKVYKEFSKKDSLLINTKLKNEFTQADSLPMHYFSSHFTDFQHYTSSLKSAYRNSVKRAQNRFKGMGMYIQQTNDPKRILALYTPEVHKLYLAVVDNAETKLEIMPYEFFTNLVQNFKNDVYFSFAFDIHNNVKGFNCSLLADNQFCFIFCGMDYNVNNQSNLYYNLIYNSLDQGLKAGASLIQLGQTTDDFKARLGCYSAPLYILVKMNNRFLDILFKKYAKLLFPSRNIKLHNVYNINISQEAACD